MQNQNADLVVQQADDGPAPLSRLFVFYSADNTGACFH